MFDPITKQLRHLKETDPKKFAKALMQMSNQEISKIIHDPYIFLRDKQLPPEGDWRYWLVVSGRGWGKTRCGSSWIIEKAKENKGTLVVCGQHHRDLVSVMIDIGPSSIMKTVEPEWKPTWNKSSNFLKFPNGCEVICISGDSPESARGLSSYACWIDEGVKYRDFRETWLQLDLGCRGFNSQMLLTTTPKNDSFLKELYNKAVVDEDPLYRWVTGTTYENEANLDKNYLRSLKEAYGNSSIGRQEIEAALLFSSEDALFTNEILDKYRVQEIPENLVSVCVSIDPAMTDNKNSDMTGLVVCGVDDEGHGYVLGDYSLKASPSGWATKAVALFDQYAEYSPFVAIEVNQGGDSMSYVLNSVRQNLPIKEVRASSAKMERMMPISLLAEQGKIHMVGNEMLKLEAQLCEYDGTGKSPDRFDAVSQGLGQLLLKKRNIVTSTEFYL